LFDSECEKSVTNLESDCEKHNKKNNKLFNKSSEKLLILNDDKDNSEETPNFHQNNKANYRKKLGFIYNPNNN